MRMAAQGAGPGPGSAASPGLEVSRQKLALRRKKVLSAEEMELYELAQAAGGAIDPDVFKILVDLLKLNVAPLAVFQMLKSMCAGQRLASEPQDPAALSLPTSSVPETRGQSRACCPCPGGGGGRRGWGRRGTAASGVALCGQACLWGLDPAPAGPIRGLCSGALLLALAGMSRSGGHRVHAPGWSRRARAPPLSSLPTSSLRPSSHKVGNQDSLGLGTVVPAYNPSHNGRIVRSHEFETSLGDRVRSYL
ncbi:uncharacterized protein LOC100401380 isoform X2 [Callithrix jacchus]